jgi:replication factor C subunit 3/5
MNEIPWTEKYRPNNFEDIILEENNKKLLNNIIDINYFPNLLFYGPPGCGKTTTILNIIKSFQNKNNIKNNSSIIHLNASDDRGIDVIRNNIFNFIKTNNLFDCDYKFIILDEVDYMTKSAQQALKYIIQMYNKNICYCLICNYISKIDNSLKNEFINIRFNNLPKDETFKFINNINITEQLNLSVDTINNIINYFNSDVRSMVNYLQKNSFKNKNIMDNNSLHKLFIINTNNNVDVFLKEIFKLERVYEIDKKNIIINYIYYILYYKIDIINNIVINNLEHIVHNINNNNNIHYKIKFLYFLIKS